MHRWECFRKKLVVHRHAQHKHFSNHSPQVWRQSWHRVPGIIEDEYRNDAGPLDATEHLLGKLRLHHYLLCDVFCILESCLLEVVLRQLGSHTAILPEDRYQQYYPPPGLCLGGPHREA